MQIKYANFSNAHAQTFVMLNAKMAIVSTCFRKLKFWLWLLWTVFYLKQTGFLKIYLNKLYSKANKEILIHINQHKLDKVQYFLKSDYFVTISKTGICLMH